MWLNCLSVHDNKKLKLETLESGVEKFTVPCPQSSSRRRCGPELERGGRRRTELGVLEEQRMDFLVGATPQTERAPESCNAFLPASAVAALR